MGFQRHRFDISTDTGGDWVDTGAPITGFITQMRLSGANFDTGTDIRLEYVQAGVVVADYDNCGGSWTRSPRIATFDTGGAEVGSQHPLACNEQLRLTVNQSEGVTGSKTGTLWVWTAG